MIDSTVIYANDIEGFIPAIDPRRAQKPFIIDGQNYIFDIDGPKAFFGASLISYRRLVNPESVATFRVEDDIFLFTLDGIYSIDQETGNYYPLFTYTFTDVPWPWSVAKCGNSYFFCRKGVGVIEHNLVTKNWSFLTGSFVPEDPAYITQSSGRLVILGVYTYAWSAQDDGADLEPSLITGAGFQSLSSLLGGTAFFVGEVIDGFIVATSRGIIKATAISSAATFRHKILSVQVRLFSPFCATTVDDYTIVLLTATGFFITAGDTPKPWQAVMSEDLTVNVIPQLDLRLTAIIRLDYMQTAKLFLVSISSNSAPGKYSDTRVLYTPSNKWGQFGRPHVGFGELHLERGPNRGSNVGYLCVTGTQFVLNNIPQVERFGDPLVVADSYWVSAFDYPMRVEAGVHVFSSSIYFWWDFPYAWKDLPSGRYHIQGISFNQANPPGDLPEVSPYMDDTYAVFVSQFMLSSTLVQWRAQLQDQIFSPLESRIKIGLFRFAREKVSDEFSFVEDFIVGAQAGQASGSFDEDWMEGITATDVVEDWMEITEEEDWGFNVASEAAYRMQYMQTDDGTNLIASGAEEPQLLSDMGGSRLYKTKGYASLYHIFELSADEIGETFRLKLLNITGRLAGRFGG